MRTALGLQTLLLVTFLVLCCLGSVDAHAGKWHRRHSRGRKHRKWGGGKWRSGKAVECKRTRCSECRRGYKWHCSVEHSGGDGASQEEPKMTMPDMPDASEMPMDGADKGSGGNMPDFKDEKMSGEQQGDGGKKDQSMPMEDPSMSMEDSSMPMEDPSTPMEEEPMGVSEEKTGGDMMGKKAEVKESSGDMPMDGNGNKESSGDMPMDGNGSKESSGDMPMDGNGNMEDEMDGQGGKGMESPQEPDAMDAPKGGDGDCGNSGVSKALEETNKYRSQSGKEPLSCSGAATGACMAWAQKMCDQNQFNHGAFDANCETAGFGQGSCKENIAMNMAEDTEASAVQAVKQWWTSTSGHKEAMLSDVEMVGLGYYQCDRKVYWCGLFGTEG